MYIQNTIQYQVRTLVIVRILFPNSYVNYMQFFLIERTDETKISEKNNRHLDKVNHTAKFCLFM